MNFTLHIHDTDIKVRLLAANDTEALYQYLNGLSAETVKRFQPHSFDFAAVQNICSNAGDTNILRIIAVADEKIIAYMLFKKGWVIEDLDRYSLRNQFFDENRLVTFAPSVADGWQSCGLGTAMYNTIETELRQMGIAEIVLWGGTQAPNSRAVHYYEKLGYKHYGSFFWNGINNYDMVKRLGN